MHGHNDNNNFPPASPFARYIVARLSPDAPRARREQVMTKPAP